MQPAVTAELTATDAYNGSNTEHLRQQGGQAAQPEW